MDRRLGRRGSPQKTAGNLPAVQDHRPHRLVDQVQLESAVFTAESGEEALKCVREKHPQVLLIDYRLKEDMTGLDFLKVARLVDPRVPAIVITGLSEQVEALQAACEQVGISAFFQKPLQMEAVYDAVKKALTSSLGS